MAEFTITYSENAKTLMEEAYNLSGQDLVDAIISDIKQKVERRLNRKRTKEVKTTFDFNK